MVAMVNQQTFHRKRHHRYVFTDGITGAADGDLRSFSVHPPPASTAKRSPCSRTSWWSPWKQRPLTVLHQIIYIYIRSIICSRCKIIDLHISYIYDYICVCMYLLHHAIYTHTDTISTYSRSLKKHGDRTCVFNPVQSFLGKLCPAALDILSNQWSFFVALVMKHCSHCSVQKPCRPYRLRMGHECTGRIQPLLVSIVPYF